jgi:mono/diheme cytochrome c family protein
MFRNKSTSRLLEETAMIKWISGILILMTSVIAAQAADESQIRLKDGPGRDLVSNNCATCHSLDYIPMNSPLLDRKGWESEVNKMVNVMHAPIDKKDIPAIVDYLERNYGVASDTAAATTSK